MGARATLVAPLAVVLMMAMATATGPAFALVSLAPLAPLVATVIALVTFARSVRKRFPARVNCWFCNSNMWVPYRSRNSWSCKKCDQYNGFRPDGDYNVVLDTRSIKPVNYVKNIKPIASPDNGLCHRCNINQQLKISQLSGFVPMHERNFNAEINEFKSHLEKVYSLCSTCKRYVKGKLLSERGLLLGSKLLNGRTKREVGKKTRAVNLVKDILKDTSRLVIILFLVFSAYNVLVNLELFASKRALHATRKYVKDSFADVKNITSPYVDKFSESFGSLARRYPFLSNINAQYASFYREIESYANFTSIIDMNDAFLKLDILEILTVTGFILQILYHLFSFNLSKKNFADDAIWGLSVYVSTTGNKFLYLLQVVFAIILSLNSGGEELKIGKSSKGKIKNLSHAKNFEILDENTISEDSDSDSSYDTCSYTKEFVGSVKLKSSPKSVRSHRYEDGARGLFSERPRKEFVNKFRLPSDMNRNELDLNKSIGSLSIGRKTDNGSNNDSLFVPRQYNCMSPTIFAASPARFAKPILSPSKLTRGMQQSWVAGGYWGADNSQLSCNLHETGSSSSQSSGFESLTSSVYRRNPSSFPPSREESICGDNERKNESFYHSPCGTQSSASTFNSFMPQKSPVFPVIKSNETLFVPSAPFDSSYGNLYNSAFVKPNPNKSFVPLNGSFTSAT